MGTTDELAHIKSPVLSWTARVAEVEYAGTMVVRRRIRVEYSRFVVV